MVQAGQLGSARVELPAPGPDRARAWRPQSDSLVSGSRAREDGRAGPRAEPRCGAESTQQAKAHASRRRHQAD